MPLSPPASLGYIPLLLPGTKWEGTATSHDDGSNFRPKIDEKKPHYGASLTLYVPDDSSRTVDCTAAWACDPEVEGTNLRISHLRAEPGLQVTLTIRDEGDEDIAGAAYLQGIKEVTPPLGFEFTNGRTKYYEVPVMVMAGNIPGNLNPPQSNARSTRTTKREAQEESEWDKVDRYAGSVDSQEIQSTALSQSPTTPISNDDAVSFVSV